VLEGKGVRISKSNTKYIEYEFDEREQIDVARSVITINGDE